MRQLIFAWLILCSAMNHFSLAFGEGSEPNAHLETHVNLITRNENLERALYVAGSAILVLVLALVYWRKKAVYLGRIHAEANDPGTELRETGSDPDKEMEMVRMALNIERAKVVRHEIQKKELLAYIDELKALQGSTEVRHKTTQIQRIFAEQKTDDIVNKVESTAKVLYPELVEAVQKRYPELNKLELQYCMMLTLGYNLDEVMSVLGRSEKAIKSLRYRIRKKMKLENPQSLKRLINEMKDYLSDNQKSM
jgi:DNA-binding CsgD family transcriptional regulator